MQGSTCALCSTCRTLQLTRLQHVRTDRTSEHKPKTKLHYSLDFIVVGELPARNLISNGGSTKEWRPVAAVERGKHLAAQHLSCLLGNWSGGAGM